MSAPDFDKAKAKLRSLEVTSPLGEWDAGLDDYDIPPREWLLGNSFCRRFVSSQIAEGGVGKTALRIVQGLSCATGRPLTNEHVFQRCRVLMISLEDDRDELRRRIKAAMIYHDIKPEDVAGWLYLSTPRGLLLAEMQDGVIKAGGLDNALRSAIRARDIGLAMIDPLVKSHRVEENSNGAMDFVTASLAQIAIDLNCAIDANHHASKGSADPGNANRGRGASSVKDAARLVYTLTPMAPEEAQSLGVTEAERRGLVRLDSAKVNIAPPMNDAKWFRLVGVKLENGTEAYPKGDEVQTVEPWSPPDTWAGLSHILLNEILNDIGAGLSDGNRYSDASKAADRAAWKVVVAHAPEKSEAAAKQIIKTWLQNGVLVREDYHNPVTRKKVSGLRVDDTKRPS